MEKGKKTKFRILSVLLAVLLLFCFASAASAAGNETEAANNTIEKGIKLGLGQVYSLLCKTALPVAGVIAAWCGIKLMGTDKDMQKAKEAFIRIGIGLGIVFLAPLIIYTIAGWFDTGTTGDAKKQVFGTAVHFLK